MRGQCYIISAPSGTGKSTLLKRLFTEDANCVFSCSHTTRLPREGETNGVDYHFVDEKTFRALIEADAFLEYAQVHQYFYGTSQAAVEGALEQGKDVFLDIDVVGAAIVRQKMIDVRSIFIFPPSFQSLGERLRKRGKDSEDVIQTRLSNACGEMQQHEHYDYVLVNNNLDVCYQSLRAIIVAERQKTTRIAPTLQEILESFGQCE